MSSGKLMRENFVDSLSFENKKGLIVVQAQLNDSQQKHDFIFDTGAFETKVEWNLAAELELPTKATKSNATAQGISQTVEVTQLKRIKLGHTSFSTISAGKLKYADTSYSPCVAEDGIIGANLIQLVHWKVNYQKKMIYFSDRPFEATTNKASVDFKKPLLSGVPKISIEVAGKKVSGVLVDVGYNGGLILPAHLAPLFSSQVENYYLDQSTSGIFGTNIDTLISKELEVSIGEVDMRIPVEFSTLGKALIGNDILEHFELSIDYDAKTIDFSPTTEIEVIKPYAFIPGILNDSLWVVDRTTEAWTVSLGDTLKSVNGFRPHDLYASRCEYFFNLSDLLQMDSLRVTKLDGQVITIRSANK